MKKKNNFFLAAVLILIAQVLVASSLLIQKIIYTSTPITQFYVIYYSNILSIIFILCQSIIQKVDLLNVPKEVRFILFKRGFFGSLTFLLYSTSIKLIIISKAATIFWTNPIFGVIFAKLILKEPLHKADIIIILATIIGIVVLENPFGNKESDDSSFIIELIGSGFALAGSITFGLTCVLMKQLSSKVHVTQQLVSWVIGTGLMASSMFLFQNSNSQEPTPDINLRDIILIILNGICLYFHIFTQTLAYKFEKVTTLAPLLSTQLVIIQIFELAILKTKFQINSIIGCGIIILANIIGNLIKIRQIDNS